jgi:hypothetical protein
MLFNLMLFFYELFQIKKKSITFIKVLDKNVKQITSQAQNIRRRQRPRRRHRYPRNLRRHSMCKKRALMKPMTMSTK